jgi:hypothetical membrane protein
MNWILEVYPFFTLMGSLIILLGSWITAIAYRGKNGERYSITRYFVSELGEVGVSRLSWLFNGSLIIGSAFFLIMMPGVGIRLGNLWGYLGMVAGMVASAACLLVGVFPMNRIKLHTNAAMTYFRFGMATVLLFSLAILAQPAHQRVIPLKVMAVGGMAFAAYAAFLIHTGRMEKKHAANLLDTADVHERPHFWWTPFLEWLVVILTILWFLALSTGQVG